MVSREVMGVWDRAPFNPPRSIRRVPSGARVMMTWGTLMLVPLLRSFADCFD